MRVSRVLLVSPDRVAEAMAGPGIRYFELARVLGRHHHVVLAAPSGSSPPGGGPEPVEYDPERPRSIRRHLAGCDVVVAPPLAPRLVAPIARQGRSWIVDLYNPEPFEGLELQRGRPRLERKVRDLTRIDRIGFAARRGNAFVCASERQRDMWLGFLAASGRLDSDLYAHDRALRSLIDVVPFGLPGDPPRAAARPVARGTIVPEDARIMLWNGGIWDWLDPLTVLRALSELRARDRRWVLVFSGMGRPSHRPPMEMSSRVAAYADDLGLAAAGAVKFVDEWTPYGERAGLLLEADVGVSAHEATAESRFAHRARVLDCLWAGLPILCTAGGEWALSVVSEDLGAVVPPQDPSALAAAAERIVDRGRASYAGPLAAAAGERTWERAAEPLLRLIETGVPRRSSLLDPVSIGRALRYSTAEAARRITGSR
jgi:glycosyltransferase involved in cell wall biosynthesis